MGTQAEVAALTERLRLAEQKLALAEAQLALAKVAPAPAWAPEPGTRAAVVAERLAHVGPALDVLFHTAKVVMVLVDADGTVLRANQEAARIWGAPVDQLPGQTVVESTAPEDRLRSSDTTALSQRGLIALKTYLRPDGVRIPALAMGWPLVDDDGMPVCNIAVVVPLSRVNAPDEELDRLFHELAQYRAARG